LTNNKLILTIINTLFMKNSLKFSTQTKMVSGFTVIIVLIVIALSVALYSFNNIIQVQNKVKESFRVTRSLTQLRTDENHLSVLMGQFMYSQNTTEREKYMHEIIKTRGIAEQSFNQIKLAIIDIPGTRDEFDEIERLLISLSDIESNLKEMVSQNKIEEAHNLFSEKQVPLFEEIGRHLLILEKILDDRTESLDQQSKRVVNNTYITLITLATVLVIVSLIIIIGIRRMLARVSDEMKEGVAILGTSSAEIQTTVAEISTSAAETATAIAETTTTMEEIRQTSIVSSQKAKNLLFSSQKSFELAEKGLESSQQMIDAIKKIDNQMKVIRNTITILSEQNRSIGEITSTVSDIADQSNLLAVNAAIEAAKAGEHGRGFTVVAQEIRSLAEQSKKSTAQVKEILNEIQKSVNLAVEVISQGAKTVEEGSVFVMEDRQVVEALTKNVEEAVQASIQISSSSQQQMAGMDQIVPAMENIKQASEQNVAGIRQAQSATRDLNELSQNLQKIIERYRL